MTTKNITLDGWRGYFKDANSGIFDIIENAIKVAASDFPNEFRLRRGDIVELLFSCKLNSCLGCNRVQLMLPSGENRGDEESKSKVGRDDNGCEFDAGGSKESNVSIGRDEQGVESDMIHISNYSYEDAVALTDEIEEEAQTIEEVLRIKDILYNSEDESESVLLDSLTRLQLMALSVEILQVTEVGKAVKTLKKNPSKKISQFAWKLIQGWMVMIDETMVTTEAVASAEGSPESGKTSITNISNEEEEEEEGLPSPPLDEGAFFATQPTSIEFSQFFDGIDDNGNPQNNGEFKKSPENGKSSLLKKDGIPQKKDHYPDEMIISPKEKKTKIMKKPEALVKTKTRVVPSNKISSTESGSVRQAKLNGEVRVDKETKFQQKSEKATVQRKPLVGQQNKMRHLDEGDARVKLEITKRKLQERYQQVENAKKQRTIQVMELHDLPKQGLGHRNSHVRPGTRSRHLANGRR